MKHFKRGMHLSILSLLLFSVFSFLTISAPKVTHAADAGFDATKFPYKSLQIQIMPEFDYPDNWAKDQPSLLVGQYGTLINKSGQDYSGEIQIKAPVTDQSFQVYMVAEFPKENEPESPREFKVDKDKGVISWTPGAPIKPDGQYAFVVEYYENPFKITDQKAFSYSYTSIADVETADLIFYAPIGSSQFTMDPKAMDQSKSDFGEDLYHFQFTQLKAGDKKDFNISYVKADNTSSLSVIRTKTPNDANHGGAANAPQAQGSTGPQPIIDATGATIIGVSLIILGVFIYLGLKARGQGKGPTPITRTSSYAVKKKVGRKDEELAKKQIRRKLLNGEIDEKVFEQQISDLNRRGEAK